MRSTLVLLAAFGWGACYGGIHLSGAGGDADVFDGGDDPGDADFLDAGDDRADADVFDGGDGPGDADADGSCTPRCVFWEGSSNQATKRCGDDRCGGSCGACPAGLLCLDGFWCRDVIGCGDRCEEQVFIPAGPFFRGCDPSRFVDFDRMYCSEDRPPSHATPQHEVFLSAYYIDRFEVVHRRYQRCVDAGVCEAPPAAPPDWGEPWHPADGYFDERPVAGVTREMAERFCRWEGKRLPTEAEWEKAARGGCELRGDPAACDWIEDAPKHVWGNDTEGFRLLAGTDACFYDWQECLVNCFNYVSRSIGPAGSYPLDVSAYGVHDLAGNASEWVYDVWRPYAYIECGVPCVDPVSDPPAPDDVWFLARGGNYRPSSSVATGLFPIHARALISSSEPEPGFRCAADAD